MAGALWAAWTAAAIGAETARKGHVTAKIQERRADEARDRQEAAAAEAERKAEARERAAAAQRNASAKAARMTQREAIVKKNPFKRKGSMRSQFTIGDGDSGAKY